MASLLRFPVRLPLRGVALAALCALYLLAGLTGHDPWKNDDATHFGVVYSFLNSGDWWIPRLAGSAFLEAPPLYYWVAAACGRLFGWLLPLHDAVRLATGIFGAVFLGFLMFASRTLWGLGPVQPGGSYTVAVRREDPASSPYSLATPDIATRRRESVDATVMVAIGSLGLLVPIHDTQPLIALLAASAATYAGFALLLQRPLAGGAMAGAGIGLGFLSAGATALATLAPLLLLLPLSRHWRSAASLRGLAVATAVATLLCASWPALLAWLAPGTLEPWWSNLFAGTHYQINWLDAVSDYAELLAWFAWPALPLAAWALWLYRHRLGQPAIFLPLVGTLATLLALLLIYEPRPTQALPVLVPLILLAAGGASRLQRGAANAFDWFGMMTFAIVATLIWLGGIAMTSGIPSQIAHNFAKLAPGFTPHFSPLAYAAAAGLSLTWFWLIFASPRSPWRAVTNWATGTTLAWVLLMALWLPWIDHGKSYRDVAASLKQKLETLPQSRRCIAGRNLGSAQRVSLQYFAGIVTVPAGTNAARACQLLLEQGEARERPKRADWRKVWEGHRPGDHSERLRLYRREEK